MMVVMVMKNIGVGHDDDDGDDDDDEEHQCGPS